MAAAADRREDNSREHRIAFADMLRALAIFAVVCDHITNVLPYSPLLGVVATFGLYGVNVLFVLTGFLLSRPYLESILTPERHPFPSTRLFLARRFYRIYPLYAFAVIVTALAHKYAAGTLPNVAVHLTFLHGFFPRYDGQPFGPLWTMAVDAQFYLLLPLIAFGLYRIGRDRSYRARTAIIGAALLGAVSTAIAWRAIMAVHAPAIFLDKDVLTVMVRNVVGMAPSFVFGIALALVAARNMRVPQPLAAGALGTGLALVLPFCVLGVRNDQTTVIWGDVVGGLSAVLIFGGLIEGRFPLLIRVARARTMTVLAALSYAVYLFHKPIIVGVDQILARHGHATSPADRLIFVVVVALLLALTALVAHHCVEKPFLRLRDRKREIEIVPTIKESRVPLPAPDTVKERVASGA